MEPVLGRYEVLGLIATGGMAEVLLGRLIGPAGFERPVVIKRILPHLAREDHFRSMFLDEARIVAHLNHRNIVQVFELGERNGSLFLVLEYLEGESLDALLHRFAARREHLDFACAAHIIAESCAGLAAAHGLIGFDGKPRPVIHRDISPSNLFVTYDGNVKIIDFGIALDADRRSLTQPGYVRGKWAYMSPEQARGAALDPRTDLFSLGVVLYELTTGRRLFRRKTEALTLAALLSEPIPPPSQFVRNYPKELEEVCLHALARRPADRFRDAAQMGSALLECVYRVAERDPGRTLHSVMRSVFADRIEEKRRVLASIAEGTQIEILREDSEPFDLPTVVETLALPEPPAREQPQRTASFAEAVLDQPGAETLLPLGVKARPRVAPWLLLCFALVLGAWALFFSEGPPEVAMPVIADPRPSSPVFEHRAMSSTVAAPVPIEVQADPPKPARPKALRRKRKPKGPDDEAVPLEPYRVLDEWAPLPPRDP